MDIEILLALQEFRTGAGAGLADFFAKMTFLAELNTVLVIMAVLYWSVNKEIGTYLLMGWSGNRLVNGAKMANDTFKGVGWCSAFLLGWILERRFIGFTTDVPFEQRMARGVIGLMSYYAVSLILVPMIKGWISGPAGTLISCFFQMFFVAFLFPWCMVRIEEKAVPAQP